MSTETVWTIRDGEPQDVDLDFHTAPELLKVGLYEVELCREAQAALPI